MSFMTPELAAQRIAAPGQPLAAFEHLDRVNVVFADTINTQDWIRRGTPKLIGVWSGWTEALGVSEKDYRESIRRKLERHTRVAA
jgi:hypothetical protein